MSLRCIVWGAKGLGTTTKLWDSLQLDRVCKCFIESLRVSLFLYFFINLYMGYCMRRCLYENLENKPLARLSGERGVH